MRAFPTNFATEAAKKTGAAPVWILKLTVNAVDYYLSDNTFTIASWNGGITTKSWVQSWGKISEALSGSLNEIRVADLDVTCLVDPDEATNMEDLATDSTLEKSLAILYLWYHGLDASTDPPQEILRGHVKDADIPDETTVNLIVEDETTRLRNLIGTLINTSDYAGADPDDIGRIIPIPYGEIINAPTVALEAGLLTSLGGDLTAVATTVPVARTDGWSSGDTFSSADEEITIGTVDAANSQFTGCTRGANSTTATTHSNGDPVVEVKSTDFVFVLSEREITSLDRVFVRAGGPDGLEVEITDLCTRYTGATGSQYTGYSNKYLTMACVVITQAQAESIRSRVLQAGVLSISDPDHSHASSVIQASPDFDHYSMISGSYSNTGGGYAAIDNDLETRALGGSGDIGKFGWQRPVGLGGVPKRLRIGGTQKASATANCACYLRFKNSTKESMTLYHDGGIYYTDWWDIPAVDQLWSNLLVGVDTYFEAESPSSGTNELNALWMEVEYDPTTSTTSTGITGSVNSLADAILGGPIYCDIDAGNSAPADLFDDFLDTYCGVTSFNQIGTLPASYALNGVITEYRPALEWLTRLAFQCRCWFRMMGGTAKLIYRPDSLSSDKVIPACRIDSGRKILSRRKAPDSEILNTIDLKYNRDWPKPAGPDAYLAISSTSDSTSITDYGTREWPEMFLCDFITDTTMAASVRDFYLAQYKRRYWLYEFETFLDHADLEFGDDATLSFAGSTVVEIQDVGFSPGDMQTMDVIRFVGRD